MCYAQSQFVIVRRQGVQASELFINDEKNLIINAETSTALSHGWKLGPNLEYLQWAQRGLFSAQWAVDHKLIGDSVVGYEFNLVNPASLSGLQMLLSRIAASHGFEASPNITFNFIVRADMWVKDISECQALCCFLGDVACAAGVNVGREHRVVFIVDDEQHPEFHGLATKAGQCPETNLGETYQLHDRMPSIVVCPLFCLFVHSFITNCIVTEEPFVWD